jgi:hypothetical protein
MLLRYMIALSLLGILLAGGCREKPAQTVKTPDAKAGATTTTAADQSRDGQKYPIALSLRPYQDVHGDIKKAWFLVETSYYVVSSKWAEADKLLKSGNAAEVKRGGDLKQQLTTELERSIFGTNDKVEALFKQAIAAEPENPLNMASYAFYLRARKRMMPNSDSFNNTEGEALEWMDKAIAKWPDEWSFYMMKAFILNEPLFCYEWFRASAMEELAIEKRLPMIRELCTKAEQYYPQNSFINYYKMMVIVKFSDPAKFSEYQDELMREIRAGNAKSESVFFFFPPLCPEMNYALKPVLRADLPDAQYIDQWTQSGHLDMNLIAQITIDLSKDYTWPKDKDNLQTLMMFLYKIGRTEPRDRSVFSLQSQLMQPIAAKLEPGSPDALKFAEVNRFLNDQYHDIAQLFFDRGYIKDRTKIDVIGVAETEKTTTRQPGVYTECQGRQAAYLKRAGEILGLKFDLPEDPDKW